MAFYTYIAQCSDGTYYSGFTKDLSRRIWQHNNSFFGAKYTKSRRPVILKYFEEFDTLSKALKREFEIKKLTHLEKHNLIKSKVL